jgi:carbonic anhydrase
MQCLIILIQTWVQFSTNYTFEVAFADTGHVCSNLQITWQNSVYTMKQIHFHSPSEHTIGGSYFSAEAHLVHRNSAGQLLVLGIPLQASSDNLMPRNNSFFQIMWNYGGENAILGIPTEVENAATLMSPYTQFLPGRFSYYHYNGSLTTPPCSEGVMWFVLDEPLIISQYDLKTLRKAIGALPTNVLSENGNDNRDPTMPLNGRSVIYVSGDSTSGTTTVNNNNDDNSDDSVPMTANAGVALSVISIVLTLALAVWTFMLNNKIAALQAQLANSRNVAMTTMKTDNPMTNA